MSAAVDVASIASALVLGAFHGLNPAMGWLFAVFLGLQRQSQRVLLTALLPITAGHAISVALIALLIVVAQSTVSTMPVRLATAVLLLGFGLYRLLTRLRHPRWVGLKIGYRDLVWWSFLMATAHGSGLMLAPLLLGVPGAEATIGLVTAHTLAMLVVMGVVAAIVYRKLGLAILQRYWINFDLLWVFALLIAGTIALSGLLIAPAH